LPTIPVWKTVADAYRITLSDLTGVALLGWLPWLITFLFSFTIGFLGFLTLLPVASLAVMTLIETICSVYFAIAMHRRRLFGHSVRKVRWQLKSAEMIFLTFALTYAFVYGFILKLGLNGEDGPTDLALGLQLSMIVVAPFITGAALILPAAAQGQPQPIRVGWHLGKGVRWRLFAIVILASLPIGILSRLTAPFATTYPVVYGITASLLIFPLTAITIAAICIAYKIRTADLGHADNANTDIAATVPSTP